MNIYILIPHAWCVVCGRHMADICRMWHAVIATEKQKDGVTSMADTAWIGTHKIRDSLYKQSVGHRFNSWAGPSHFLEDNFRRGGFDRSIYSGFQRNYERSSD